MFDKKRALSLALLVGCTALTALGFVSVRAKVSVPLTEITSPTTAVFLPSRDRYVKRNMLGPRLRDALNVLGDRLERPGKERISFTGTLQRGEGQPLLPFQFVSEFPDQLRITLQEGLQTQVIIFNGERVSVNGNPPSRTDEDLVEMLVYDTPEHFFYSQMRRAATKLVGNRFPSGNGSFYDVYEVADIRNSPATALTKLYYLNSETQLVERVRYDVERRGAQVAVETRLSEWQRVQGQQLARRVVRLENQQTVLTVLITSLAISPRADDGIFLIP